MKKRAAEGRNEVENRLSQMEKPCGISGAQKGIFPQAADLSSVGLLDLLFWICTEEDAAHVL